MKNLGFYHQTKLSHQLFCIFQQHKITYTQLLIAALFVVRNHGETQVPIHPSV